jgi:hypothetical protein
MKASSQRSIIGLGQLRGGGAAAAIGVSLHGGVRAETAIR